MCSRSPIAKLLRAPWNGRSTALYVACAHSFDALSVHFKKHRSKNIATNSNALIRFSHVPGTYHPTHRELKRRPGHTSSSRAALQYPNFSASLENLHLHCIIEANSFSPILLQQKHVCHDVPRFYFTGYHSLYRRTRRAVQIHRIDHFSCVTVEIVLLKTNSFNSYFTHAKITHRQGLTPTLSCFTTSEIVNNLSYIGRTARATAAKPSE